LIATLDFTSFFTMAFLVPHPLFTAGLFWIRFALTVCYSQKYSTVIKLLKGIYHFVGLALLPFDDSTKVGIVFT